jgi:tetratricopeptide (TPR) repeat protein
MSPQGCPAPSSPQANVSQGNAFRLKGIDADEAGRYAEAISYYECALQFGSDPKILHNLAYPYEKVGRYADALTALLRFKASGPPELLAPDLDKRIATLRNRATALTVHANIVGARVLVRDVAVGTKPADKPLVVWVNAGRATVEVNAEGYKRFLKEVELSPGGSHEFDVQLRPLNDAQPSVIIREVHREVAATPFWSQWWFWAGASVIVVGGATTIYALSSEKDPRGGSLGITSGPLRSGLGSLGLHF